MKDHVKIIVMIVFWLLCGYVGFEIGSAVADYEAKSLITIDE